MGVLTPHAEFIKNRFAQERHCRNVAQLPLALMYRTNM